MALTVSLLSKTYHFLPARAVRHPESCAKEGVSNALI